MSEPHVLAEDLLLLNPETQEQPATLCVSLQYAHRRIASLETIISRLRRDLAYLSRELHRGENRTH